MSEEIKIRRATADDIPKIVELAVELVTLSRSIHRPGVSDEQIRRYRRENFDQLTSILEMPEGGLFVAGGSGKVVPRGSGGGGGDCGLVSAAGGGVPRFWPRDLPAE